MTAESIANKRCINFYSYEFLRIAYVGHVEWLLLHAVLKKGYRLGLGLAIVYNFLLSLYRTLPMAHLRLQLAKQAVGCMIFYCMGGHRFL